MKNVYSVYYNGVEGDNMAGSAYGENEEEALKDFAEKMYIYNGGTYKVTGIEFYKRISF